MSMATEMDAARSGGRIGMECKALAGMVTEANERKRRATAEAEAEAAVARAAAAAAGRRRIVRFRSD